MKKQMKKRYWNLNEMHGWYTSTTILESTIDLDFGLKRMDGSMEKVGRYFLDLDLLNKQGFVSSRLVEGQRAFQIKIFRKDGSYSIGVHQDNTTPLLSNVEGRV
jgi:hypothetical protein